MKLPLSWLQEIIDINDPPHLIANTLTMLGLEVDGVEKLPLGFEGVVVGEVLEIEKHPEADKLCVAKVTDGSETFQVVCGASNCRKGLKTAFAKTGAKLTDEKGETFKIKKGKLRGVESFGMLCSETELGIGTNDDGITEFEEHIQVGADVADLYGDTIFDISLTPNLGHCSSILGIARELAASTEKNYVLPQFAIKEEGESVEKAASVKVENFTKCPRYAARVIKNVKLGPSPSWLQKKLTACGQRPVNNIVDITNFVLMEMGHPLHAFDYDLIEGHQIVVRNAKEGEQFVTLDDKKHTLTEDDLLICDPKKPVAIAGVMGGANSEVSDKTVNVLLESAYFEPASVRRTSKRTGISTEASKRFERGTDPNSVSVALDRAAQLMVEIAGGELCKGVIDIKKHDFPEKTLECRYQRVNDLLGIQLSLSEMENIFKRLEMKPQVQGEIFKVTVPTYRNDIHKEIDLVEEVARLFGYDNFPKKKSALQIF